MNVKEYFEQLGYDPDRFTVTEDEPSGLLCIKVKGFFAILITGMCGLSTSLRFLNAKSLN